MTKEYMATARFRCHKCEGYRYFKGMSALRIHTCKEHPETLDAVRKANRRKSLEPMISTRDFCSVEVPERRELTIRELLIKVREQISLMRAVENVISGFMDTYQKGD